MNLSGLGSLLTVATSLLGGDGGSASPLGLVGSLLGGGASGVSDSASGASGASDPFSAIMNLTQDVDRLATGALGSFAGGAFAGGGTSGLLGSISGLLA